jgi:hypothetical protein
MLTVASVYLYHRNTYEGSEGEENKHDNNNNIDKEAVGHKGAIRNPRAREDSRRQGGKTKHSVA